MRSSHSQKARVSVRRLPKWVLLVPLVLLFSELAATAVHAHLHAQEDFAHPCATCAIGHSSATPIVVADPEPVPARPERVHDAPDLILVTHASPATSSRAPPTG